MTARGEARAGPENAAALGGQPRARGKGDIRAGRRTHHSTAAPQLALPGFPTADRDRNHGDYDPLIDGIGRADTEPRFDGATYSVELDHARLTGQLRRVFEAMRLGGWWTLAALSEAVGGSEAGVSARIRDLRKARFGGYVIERRRRGDGRSGVFEYRLAGDGR